MAERKNMCAKDRFRDKNFIMLPTVDVCFKGLMNNPKGSGRLFFSRRYSVRIIRMINWESST